jgi:hypothetical protein
MLTTNRQYLPIEVFDHNKDFLFIYEMVDPFRMFDIIHEGMITWSSTHTDSDDDDYDDPAEESRQSALVTARLISAIHDAARDGFQIADGEGARLKTTLIAVFFGNDAIVRSFRESVAAGCTAQLCLPKYASQPVEIQWKPSGH